MTFKFALLLERMCPYLCVQNVIYFQMSRLVHQMSLLTCQKAWDTAGSGVFMSGRRYNVHKLAMRHFEAFVDDTNAKE